MIDPFLFEREGDVLQPRDFYSALAEAEGLGYEVKQVHMSDITVRDLYTWDLNATGWRFVESHEINKPTVTMFGDLEIIRDPSIPPGHFKLAVLDREDVDD